MDYKTEYEGLVSELTRHMVPSGRWAKLVGYYSLQDTEGEATVIPAAKLSESPFIVRALLHAGAEEIEGATYTSLRCPKGREYLHFDPKVEA